FARTRAGIACAWRVSVVWTRHWGLIRVPFAELAPPYVALPSHGEAVARIVYAIESCERRVCIAAPEGMGKTTVLRKAIAEVRSGSRCFAGVSCPRDEMVLFGQLADRLGAPAPRHAQHAGEVRAFERAIRVRSLEGFHVILTIDDCDEALASPIRSALDAL